MHSSVEPHTTYLNTSASPSVSWKSENMLDVRSVEKVTIKTYICLRQR
jgi:hypothetical protein